MGSTHPRGIPARDDQYARGFDISVFAEGAERSRMMTVGPDGSRLCGRARGGSHRASADRDADGVADGVEVVARGLSAPSSLDFYTDGSLYVGETTRVVRLFNPTEEGRLSRAGDHCGGASPRRAQRRVPCASVRMVRISTSPSDPRVTSVLRTIRTPRHRYALSSRRQ